MCGRIYIRSNGTSKEILANFGLEEFQLPDLNNVAPTGQIPVIYQDESRAFCIREMRWWLHPFWEKEPPHQKQSRFNARVETVLTLHSYRAAVRRRRAIIPIDAFVEWQVVGSEKLPWYSEGSEHPLAIAAIWEVWNDEIFSCAILTQPATEAFAPLHDRMPVSLTPEQSKRWVDPAESAESLLKEFGHASVGLVERRISKEVNNARNKSDPVFL